MLEATRQQDTIILFLSDHGEMLGERGLWFKMNFFDGSARVPLMIAAPGMAPGRVDQPVSTIDVLPTLCDLAGLPMDEIAPWTDGRSLARGAPRGPVPMEYAAEGKHRTHGRPARRALEVTSSATPIPRCCSIWTATRQSA
ncbi:sulfatase-like hydrolase/transferase [Paracoccus sp. NBH48]|uniref:sulfatase-like hydrolase/transferase n=1 Tax=Paracoccus sp. NBH48 TaxID=2596918 RepID=UPI00351C2033